MISAFSPALAIAGLVTSTTTSWIAVLVALAFTVAISIYGDDISLWIRSKISSVKWRELLARAVVRRVIQVAVGFVAIFGAVVASNISVLRPNAFVGYTDQPPFKFGRYIAAIGRAALPPGGFCPQAVITGEIANVTDQPMSVWYSNEPIRVWTQSPSVVFNGGVEISNIARAGQGSSTIAPNSSLRVTISAQMDQALCKDYKAEDLQNLRRGRINATSAIRLLEPKTKAEVLESISFQDLPIALGD